MNTAVLPSNWLPLLGPQCRAALKHFVAMAKKGSNKRDFASSVQQAIQPFSA
jgi:hypothetical protein